VLARDRKATARLVELHADAVYRYVRRRLAPKTEMLDDIVQEVFLAAWRALGAYTGAAPLRSWLLSIARHKVEDYYRQTLGEPLRNLEDGEDESIPAPAADLVGELDGQRYAERAASIMTRLPYEYAIILRWRYWEDRSARDMAAASGRTEKAVERLLARARARFKALWQETA
jgi:RNA polymerase sigma-70 factor (ECF subfamily)